MKTVTFILATALVFIITNVYAQDFKGIATYKTASSMKISMDSMEVSDAQQKELNAMLSKAMQKEFELKFNKTASIWKEAESLGEVASGSQNSIEVIAIGSGSGGVLYKNTKDKNFTESTDLFGKQFLIKDELEPTEWKLEDETKQIGQYTCYKATSTREATTMSFSTGSDEDKTKKKEETRTITTTAWYTPQIPVSHGPNDYWGLPGLILEVNNGNRVVICSKIVLNPKEEIEIVPPTKGKEVNSEEFEAIMQEKMKEMEKMYHGGRKKGNGKMSIKIGG